MESETKTTKLVLPRKEAAVYLGIHVNTLDRSDIPRVSFGGRVMFKYEDLDKCFASGFKTETNRKLKCGK